MAGSVNLVILVGNCGKDPELRTLQDGTRMVNLTVATSESWIDKASGEKKEKTEWHRIVVFNDRTAGVAEKYVRKGMKLYIEGQLQTRKWTDQTGAERYSTEIVIGRFTGKMEMLSRIDDTASPREDRASPAAARAAAPTRQGGLSWDRPKTTDLDDEIPF